MAESPNSAEFAFTHVSHPPAYPLGDPTDPSVRRLVLRVACCLGMVRRPTSGRIRLDWVRYGRGSLRGGQAAAKECPKGNG